MFLRQSGRAVAAGRSSAWAVRRHPFTSLLLSKGPISGRWEASARRREAAQQEARRRGAASVRAEAGARAVREGAGAGAVEKVAAFVSKQFLPVALLAAVVMGYVWPAPGLLAAKLNLQQYTTAGIFIISGLKMRRAEAFQALSAKGALAFGLASILLLTPLIGKLVLLAPLQPHSLAVGLAVFLCMPTTLNAGVSLTATANGNVAMALLLTVVSNALGIFTMPFMLSWMLSGVGNIALQPLPLLAKLVKAILLPLAVGVALRAAVPGLHRRIDAHSALLTNISIGLLITVPWTQVACTANAGGQGLSAPMLLAVGVLAAAVHAVFLLGNTALVGLLQLGGRSAGGDGAARRGLQRAVILLASQKTLPVAVSVLGQLSSVLGGAVGVAVVPCVLAHLGQVLLDSFLVQTWINMDNRAAVAARPAAA